MGKERRFSDGERGGLREGKYRIEMDLGSLGIVPGLSLALSHLLMPFRTGWASLVREEPETCECDFFTPTYHDLALEIGFPQTASPWPAAVN